MIADRSARQVKIDAAAPSLARQQRTRFIIAAMIILVVVTGIVAAVWLGQKSTPSSDLPASSMPAGVSVSGGVNPYPSVNAQSDAPEVGIFTDFQCPACAAVERFNGDMIQDAAKTGKIKLISYPMVFLDDKLGQGDKGSSHTATNAALCAANSEKYNEFSKEMFSRQPEHEGTGFAPDSYAQAAAAVGIQGQSLTQFNTCVQDRQYEQLGAALDNEANRRNTANGTPALIINGKAVSSQDTAQLYTQPNTFLEVLAKYTQ